MDVGSDGTPNDQVSSISPNAAEKSKTCNDTLEPASTGATLPGKKVVAHTEDGVVIDSPWIPLSDEGQSGTTKVETSKASNERVNRGRP